MAETAIEKVMTAFEEFKSTNDARLKEIEKKGAADPVTAEKLGRIETDLAKLEDINQKLTAAALEVKKEKEHVDELEEKLNRLSLNGASDPEVRKAEQKAKFNLWARSVVSAAARGLSDVSAEQRKAIMDVESEYKALSIGNDTTGGYLAPSEYVREIIKSVTEISPVRTLVRVRTTASKSIFLPKRTGQFAAQWVAEQGQRTETDGLRYGMLEIPTHELYALIDISEQNLEDSAFDMASEINGEAAEQFSLAEGAAARPNSGRVYSTHLPCQYAHARHARA